MMEIPGKKGLVRAYVHISGLLAYIVGTYHQLGTNSVLTIDVVTLLTLVPLSCSHLIG